MGTWIKLYRELKDWEWYKDSGASRIFIHLLLSANHKEKKWQGITIKRGQVLTGRKSLSYELGLSEQVVRAGLKKLIRTNEITIKPTNKYSIITICKYDSYQSGSDDSNQQNNQESNQEEAIKQPSNNQQVTTTNNVNNDKKEKNVKKDKNITLHTRCKGVFMSFYKDKFNTEYYWKAMDGKHLNQLTSAIKLKMKEVKIEPTEDEIYNNFSLFLKKIKDEWVLKNLSMSIINSKFNEIYAGIKQTDPGSRAEDIVKTVAERHPGV